MAMCYALFVIGGTLWYVAKGDWSTIFPSYPISLRRYFGQTESIRPGMTVEEVRRQLTGVTGESRYPDRVHFRMEPRGKSLVPAPTQFINLYLDEKGRVARVTTSDG
jgi:hypothetical protein